MKLTMEQVLKRARPVLPVLVIEDVSLALDLAGALYAGGVEVLEGDAIALGLGKDLVGQVASKIRSLRVPEPYKGKGIKYKAERIIKKAGKTGKK